MNANITKTVLGGLLPIITNPVTLAVISIGAVGLTLYDILSDEKDGQDNGSEAGKGCSEPLIEPSTDGSSTVIGTVYQPLETVVPTVAATVRSTDEKPFDTENPDDGSERPEEATAESLETAKKELIRQAMSELGKRSAAARAKKKFIG